MGRVIADIRAAVAQTSLPPGNFVSLEGQFQAQEQATQLIIGLSLVSLALIFLVLYSRYQSVVLAGIIMANIPLALIGSVVAMWIAGVSLSVASMVGFITLTGIATRNGILKISHYVNLCKFEGETFSQAMIVRGSLERLTPVLMTALVAAFALTPLLLAADAPGKEILHPVAVVIFGGLVSSTLLDTLLTPLLFWLLGEAPTRRLLGGSAHTTDLAPDARRRTDASGSQALRRRLRRSAPQPERLEIEVALKKLVIATCLAMGLGALDAPVALAHGSATSRHGGISQMAGDLGFELVSTADGAALYVEDHGKPVAPAGMTGKLTVLNGTQKSEADLVAAGDRLEAKGVKLAPGAKVVAALTTAQKKAVTVRFTVK